MTCFPKMKDLLSYTIMLMPAGLSAQAIYISPGAQLILNGPSQLVLNNAGITNNRTTATGNSTVWLTGNDTTHAGFISDNHTLTFYKMVLNGQYGNAPIQQTVLLTDSIHIYGGNLPDTSNTSIDTTNNVVVTSGGSDSLTVDQPIPVTNPVATQVIKPEELNENLSDKIQVFPVPARNYFILTVSGERKQRSEFVLSDEAGHLLQRKKVFMLPGSNSISWDISSYPAGMYYLTAGNGKMQKIRILKQ